MTTPLELPELPALVVGTVRHTRHRPLRHQFAHGSDQWLIDLDDPPRMPWWLAPIAQVRAEDHLDAPTSLAGLKANVVEILKAHGIPATARDRVLMLAYARTLAHVFDPMTAYWCLDEVGALRGVILEVHNTYGGRHNYVIDGADASDTTMAKGFYVSPFNEVAGNYRAQVRLTPDKVAVAIALSLGGSPLLTASVAGTPRPATTGAVVRRCLRRPLMAQRVSALIRAHGIYLWLRRLPVIPRATSHRKDHA